MRRRKKEQRKNRYSDSHRDSVHRKTLTVSNLAVALIGFLFLVSVSVVLVLNLRGLYYFDIGYLRISETTGLSEKEIRENYDTLIDYNLVTGGVKNLEFPSFPMSENGRIHFGEVKRIFLVIQYMFVICGVIWIAGLMRKLFRKDYGSLKLLALFSFAIPAVLGVLASLYWDAFFETFHKLFFRNDYWLFDPVTDPVIWILPDAYFAHCAAAVLILVLFGGALTGGIYRSLKKVF